METAVGARRTQLEPFLGKLLLENPPHSDPRFAVDLIVFGPARRRQNAEGYVGELRVGERVGVSHASTLVLSAREEGEACTHRLSDQRHLELESFVALVVRLSRLVRDKDDGVPEPRASQ